MESWFGQEQIVITLVGLTVLGLGGLWVFARVLYQRLKALEGRGIQERLTSLEEAMAEVRIRIEKTEGEVRDLRARGDRYINLFRTVLHGFDYIVQGCKSVMEVEAGAPLAPPPEISPATEPDSLSKGA